MTTAKLKGAAGSSATSPKISQVSAVGGSSAVGQQLSLLSIGSATGLPTTYTIPVSTGASVVASGAADVVAISLQKYDIPVSTGPTVLVSGSADVTTNGKTEYVIPVSTGPVVTAGTRQYTTEPAMLPALELAGTITGGVQPSVLLPPLTLSAELALNYRVGVASVSLPAKVGSVSTAAGRFSAVPSVSMPVQPAPVRTKISQPVPKVSVGIVAGGVVAHKGRVALVPHAVLPVGLGSVHARGLVSAATQIAYSLRGSVAGGLKVIYSAKPHASLSVAYSLRGTIAASADMAYSLSNRDKVVTSLAFTYADRAVADLTPAYSLVENIRVQAEADLSYDIQQLVRVSAEATASYEIVTHVPISAELQQMYDVIALVSVAEALQVYYDLATNTHVAGELGAQYSVRGGVAASLASEYRMADVLGVTLSALYSIGVSDRVASALITYYTSVGSSVAVYDEPPRLLVNNIDTEFYQMDLSTNEGDRYWVGEITLHDRQVYAAIRRGDEINFKHGSDEFVLRVVEKAMSNPSMTDFSATVTAHSPVAMRMNPHVAPITYANSVAMAASEIVRELVGPVSWEMVDWVIPAYRVAATDGEAVELAASVVEAAGGVLESRKDGTLVARPKFVVSPKDYVAAIPNHVFTDMDDIISASESYRDGTVYNRFRISDTEISFSDSLDWVPDYADATTGYIVARLSPWRGKVALQHTSALPVSIGDPEVWLEELDNLVEFVAGKGQTDKPVYDILSVEWVSVDAGAIAYAEGSADVTVAGGQSGLARIKYRTRALRYRVDTAARVSTQFILESFSL